MKKIILLFLLNAFFINVRSQVSSENLFYMTDTPDAYESFIQNINQISIVAPQTFQISQTGVLSGSVDHRVLDSAKKHKIKVIPLIVNTGFNAQLLHNLVLNMPARKRSIKMMLDYAKKLKLDGWQFDMEGLNISDRDSFTAYFKETALALHQAGLSLSAAIVHIVEGVGGTTSYHNYLFENWRGGYNVKELAQAGDFLSIMSYDQHTRRTPPGPVAGADWVERNIEYLISEGVPPEKISLGIPDYSVHWFPDYNEDRGGFSNGQSLGYKGVQHLLGKYNPEIKWDDKAACHYAVWDNDGVYEYLYIEDGESLKAKLQFLNKYKLRGISVWVLGKEAPDFWTALASATTPKK